MNFSTTLFSNETSISGMISEILKRNDKFKEFEENQLYEPKLEINGIVKYLLQKQFENSLKNSLMKHKYTTRGHLTFSFDNCYLTETMNKKCKHMGELLKNIIDENLNSEIKGKIDIIVDSRIGIMNPGRECLMIYYFEYKNENLNSKKTNDIPIKKNPMFVKSEKECNISADVEYENKKE